MNCRLYLVFSYQEVIEHLLLNWDQTETSVIALGSDILAIKWKLGDLEHAGAVF